MGLGNEEGQGVTFVKFDKDEKGKLKTTGKDDVVKYFNYVSGFLEDISLRTTYADGASLGKEVKEADYKGKVFKSINFNLVEKDGNKYQLQTNYKSYMSRNIINSLYSIIKAKGKFGYVKISTYVSGDFTGISVYNDSAKLEWAKSRDELPATKKVTVGGQTLTEDTELHVVYMKMKDEINECLKDPKNRTTAVETETEPTAEDNSSEFPF